MVEDFKENYLTGWIRIYRSVKKHWIYPKNRPLTEFEAWIVILLEVNHEPEKFNIGYELYECNRGEKYYSLDTWAKLFNWNKGKVRRFLSLLQKDSMIELKNVQKSTHLIVCNYDTYQGQRNDYETIVKRKRNESETQVTPIKEYKNEKNVKNEINNKNINILLSQVDESTLDQIEKKYYQIAVSFWELFKFNMNELNISTKTLDEAKYELWVKPIRLLINTDKRNIDEIREVFAFIKEDNFWKEQIRSTEKLRKKNKDGITYFESLLIKSRNGHKRKQSSNVGTQSNVSEDYKKSILNRLLYSGNTETM